MGIQKAGAILLGMVTTMAIFVFASGAVVTASLAAALLLREVVVAYGRNNLARHLVAGGVGSLGLLFIYNIYKAI